ncbi:hypothetical protein K2Q00_01350 [Patescibacteria group bacterium]|nr:hypothetical protein [Patescibacteria group bacterium]
MKNQDPLLDFDEFKRRQNNFYMRFVGKPGEHEIGDLFRDACDAYKHCISSPEFAQMASQLQELYASKGKDYFGHDEFQKPLYEAYKLMHPQNWCLTPIKLQKCVLMFARPHWNFY